MTDNTAGRSISHTTMKRMHIANTKGFTLMELLIVMVILAILVAIATGTYASSSRRGRDNRRKNDLRNVTTALESYYNDKGKYPTGNASGEMVGCGANDTAICAWGGEFKDTNGTLYMVLIPKDPIDSQRYYYVGVPDMYGLPRTYRLYAKLENTRDEGDGVDQDGYADTDCSIDSTVPCTYGIASTNTSP